MIACNAAALGPDSKIPIPISKPNEVKQPAKEKDLFEPSCSCESTDGRERTKFSESEDAEQLIEFEDELHNTVYVR